MTSIKYSKAVLKYEDEDVYVELDARVLPANKDCDVSVVYTYDEWRSCRTKNGSFLKNLSVDESLYRISIIVNNVQRNSRIWFALKLVDHKYRDNEHAFWDNNSGINYEIIPEKLPQICLPSKELETTRPRPQNSTPLPSSPPPLSILSDPSQLYMHKSQKPSPPSSPPSSQPPSPPSSRPSSPPHAIPTQLQHVFSQPPPKTQQISQQFSPSKPRIQSSQQPLLHHVLAQPFVPLQQQRPPVKPAIQPSQPSPQYFFQYQQHSQPQSQQSRPQPQSSNNPLLLQAFQPQSQSRSYYQSQPQASTPLPPSSRQAQNKTSSLQLPKTLTPQQLYKLQYTFPRPESRRPPPTQKPFPVQKSISSYVYSPSDMFPDHSICSMMQGHHRIYDEYVY